MLTERVVGDAAWFGHAANDSLQESYLSSFFKKLSR
jgi:hypothetical protein